MFDRTEFDWSFDIREAEEFFSFAGYKARDLRRPYEHLKAWMRLHIFDHFLGEHEFDGANWAPLTEKYATWKVGQVGVMPILEFHLPLFHAANSDRAYSISPFDFHYEVFVPNKVGEDYGHFHEEGTFKMVPRPWFIPEVAIVEEVDHIFTDWLNDLKDRNARRRGRPSIASLSDIGVTL